MVIATAHLSKYMVNTYLKGNRVEKLCRDSFVAKGWLTWKPSRAKYNSNDAFGLFDFIAVRGSSIVFGQVKSNVSDFYTSRKEIAVWIETNRLLITCLCILYEGDNHWRMEWYDPIDQVWIPYDLTTQ